MTIYINSLALYNEKMTGYLCFFENTTMEWSENGTLSKMCMKKLHSMHIDLVACRAGMFAEKTFKIQNCQPTFA